MSNEKKCPSCGQWSEWKSDVNDTCTHCGSLLSPDDLKRKIKWEEMLEEKKKNWMFNYEPDAPLYEKIYKKMGSFAYMILMVITTFLMWVAAWVVH